MALKKLDILRTIPSLSNPMSFLIIDLHTVRNQGHHQEEDKVSAYEWSHPMQRILLNELQ